MAAAASRFLGGGYIAALWLLPSDWLVIAASCSIAGTWGTAARTAATASVFTTTDVIATRRAKQFA
jgi:hypothetical protein